MNTDHTQNDMEMYDKRKSHGEEQNGNECHPEKYENRKTWY